MKQKKCNIIMSICNLIGAIGLIIIVKTSFYSYSIGRLWSIAIETNVIRGAIENIIKISYFLIFIILMIANFSFSIQNRKNKKLMLWYGAISTVCALSAIIFDAQNFITSIFLYYIDIPNDFGEILMKVFALTAIIIPIILMIIDIVIIFRNRESKKRVILYILLLLSLFGAIRFLRIGMMYLVMIFLSVMQLVDNKNFERDEKRIKKVLNLIISLLITISVTGIVVNAIYTYQHAKKIDVQTVELVDEIKNNLKNVTKQNEIIIVADENGYGAINQRGKEVIPCGEYQWIFGMEGCDVLLARKMEESQYVYLSKDGKVLATCDFDFAPWMREEKFGDDTFRGMAEKGLGWISRELRFDRKTLEEKNVIKLEKEYYNNSILIQEYELNDLYKIEIEKGDSENATIRIKDRNNNIISEEIKVNVKITEELREYSLNTFSDGSVPFFNREAQIQGWFDAGTGKKQILRGNNQILDIIHDKVLVRRLDEENEIIKEYILTKDGKILLATDQIQALENGFIIKNKNNKFVYIDSNLKTKTGEYDYINGEYAQFGILICKNNDEDSYDERFILSDIEGNILTDKIYKKMTSKIHYEETVENHYLLDSEYLY